MYKKNSYEVHFELGPHYIFLSCFNYLQCDKNKTNSY